MDCDAAAAPSTHLAPNSPLPAPFLGPVTVQRIPGAAAGWCVCCPPQTAQAAAGGAAPPPPPPTHRALLAMQTRT